MMIHDVTREKAGDGEEYETNSMAMPYSKSQSFGLVMLLNQWIERLGEMARKSVLRRMNN